MIKIDFEFDSKHGVFRDALYLPDDHTYTPAQIEAMKKERFDNWVYIVENPPAPSGPPKQVEVGGETYTLLEGVPPAGAKLVEVDGHWYYKV